VLRLLKARGTTWYCRLSVAHDEEHLLKCCERCFSLYGSMACGKTAMGKQLLKVATHIHRATHVHRAW
jgi:hypothetical protein